MYADSWPFPYCRNMFCFLTEGLRNDKTAGLRGVEYAPIGDNRSQALTRINGRTGGDKFTIIGEVNHVHISPENIGFRHGEAAAGIVVADAIYNLTCLMVIHVPLTPESI